MHDTFAFDYTNMTMQSSYSMEKNIRILYLNSLQFSDVGFWHLTHQFAKIKEIYPIPKCVCVGGGESA